MEIQIGYKCNQIMKLPDIIIIIQIIRIQEEANLHWFYFLQNCIACRIHMQRMKYLVILNAFISYAATDCFSS